MTGARWPGRECMHAQCADPLLTLQWASRTTYSWSGGQNDVKSYANAGLQVSKLLHLSMASFASLIKESRASQTLETRSRLSPPSRPRGAGHTRVHHQTLSQTW